MPDWPRRKVLQSGLLTSLTGLAGCSSDIPATGTPTETSTRSPHSEPTFTVEPTPTPQPTAEDQLPVPKDGWKLVGTEGKDWRILSAKSGIIGKYESPEGILFEVVIKEMMEEFSVEVHAERWACIGWDVAVAYEEYAFAAGTGTDQQTFTPEEPPHMTKTPIPGSENNSRQLLTYSPLLSEQIISEHRQFCSE